MAAKENDLKYNFYEFHGYKLEAEKNLIYGDYTPEELFGIKYGSIHSKKMKKTILKDSLYLILFGIIGFTVYNWRVKEIKKLDDSWAIYREKNLKE